MDGEWKSRGSEEQERLGAAWGACSLQVDARAPACYDDGRPLQLPPWRPLDARGESMWLPRASGFAIVTTARIVAPAGANHQTLCRYEV